MKNRYKLIIGITSLAAVGLIVYINTSKKIKSEKMLDQIADEGYETAGDILFPLRSKKSRKYGASYNSFSEDFI